MVQRLAGVALHHQAHAGVQLAAGDGRRHRLQPRLVPAQYAAHRDPPLDHTRLTLRVHVAGSRAGLHGASDGVWAADWYVDADGVGSCEIWDASGSGGFVEGVAGFGGKWCFVYSDYDAALELGDDAGSGFAGGGVVEYGAVDWEPAGSDCARRTVGAERVVGGWVDSCFGGDVDYAVEDEGSRGYASDLGCLRRDGSEMSRDILPSL